MGPAFCGPERRVHGFCDWLEFDLEAIALEQPVVSVMFSGNGNPLKWALGQRYLLRRVPLQCDSRGHRMSQASGENNVRLVEVAARIVDAIGSCADNGAVDFDRGAGRRARDRQRLAPRRRSERRKHKQREQCAEPAAPHRLHREPPRECGANGCTGNVRSQLWELRSRTENYCGRESGAAAKQAPSGRGRAARFSPRTVPKSFHLRYFASQSRNVAYQTWLFCGFSTQWPSSGKITSFDGTPCL